MIIIEASLIDLFVMILERPSWLIDSRSGSGSTLLTCMFIEIKKPGCNGYGANRAISGETYNNLSVFQNGIHSVMYLLYLLNIMA